MIHLALTFEQLSDSFAAQRRATASRGQAASPQNDWLRLGALRHGLAPQTTGSLNEQPDELDRRAAHFCTLLVLGDTGIASQAPTGARTVPH